MTNRDPGKRPTREERESDKFVLQMMYLLEAPMLGMPMWLDTLKQHKGEITLERLGRQREIFETRQCTEFEAMLYISTASLEYALSHDWAEIYMYLFKKWSPEKAKAAGIEPPEELSRYPQQEDLNKLRHWIFRNQMNHLRAKLGRTDRAELQQEKEELDTEGTEIQQKLF